MSEVGCSDSKKLLLIDPSDTNSLSDKSRYRGILQLDEIDPGRIQGLVDLLGGVGHVFTIRRPCSMEVLRISGGQLGSVCPVTVHDEDVVRRL